MAVLVVMVMVTWKNKGRVKMRNHTRRNRRRPVQATRSELKPGPPPGESGSSLADLGPAEGDMSCDHAVMDRRPGEGRRGWRASA